jgi:ELWxxDGT repeat protein
MRQHSRQAGSNPQFRRRARPCLEEMESRLLLSVSPSLLKNLNLQPASSDPAHFLTINGITYFSANDGVHGIELWRTNGASAGTYMVKDINPNGGSDPTDLVNVNGRLLFQAGKYHEQLWVCDGTAAGTKLLRIFDQGRAGGAVVGDITLLGNFAVFIAGDVSLGTGIWRTDGTAPAPIKSRTWRMSQVSPL